MTGAEADAASPVAAFEFESIDSGAILPISGAKIANAVASWMTALTPLDAQGIRWVAQDLPVISRSDAWIVPLSWEPHDPVGGDARRHDLSARTNRMWLAIRNWCSHEFGEAVAVDLSVGRDGRGYVNELVRRGASRANWWRSGDWALVLVVSSEPSAAAESMALHIVPVGYVSERRPSKKVPPLDLRWSWADVVALAKRPTSFAPASLHTGAVVVFGTGPMTTGDDIVAAIETTLTGASLRAEPGDRWLRPGVPALSRGGAWIIPLSWEPPSADQETVRDRATELWSDVRGACEHRHGVQIDVALAADRETGGSYATELLRTGARRADWWDFGDRAVVLVVYGPPLPALKTSVSLHVVPREWVWDDAARGRATADDVEIGDLSWSWADVIAFAQRH